MKQKKEQTTKRQTEPYLKIPVRILNLHDIGLCEKLLLAHIESFGQKGCWQSNKTIAKIFMVCEKSISRWLKKIDKFIYVRNPKGYYRTIWTKSHLDKMSIDLDKNVQGVGQNRSSDLDKSGIRLGTKFPTTNNNTITENYKRTTASPSPPSPKGAPATLQYRRQQSIEQIEKFKSRFGTTHRTQPLSLQEFERRRAAMLAALRMDSKTGNGV
jgi:hypothetical protein